MRTALSILSLAQVVSAQPSVPLAPSPNPTLTPPAIQAPQRQAEVIRPQDVRPLPGQLDSVPVFNSNSPEVVQAEGILLSTFPPDGMSVPTAHLNFPFEGRFDVFAHHIARGLAPDDNRTLFMAVLVYNPNDKPVTIEVLQGVSYLSQEAPFNNLPSYIANPQGEIFAGPGSRTTTDVLRGESQSQWPERIVIRPKQSQLLMNVPIPLRRLSVATDGSLPPGYIIPSPNAQAVEVVSLAAEGDGVDGNTVNGQTAAEPVRPNPRTFDIRSLPSNGRSALMRLSSDGPVYLASLAMYAPKTANGSERVPTLTEWESLLVNSDLSGPRDIAPSRPDSPAYVRFFYGRVAGVSQGSEWNATATDSPEVDYLTIPETGSAFSYVVSTVDRNTFGTGQIQSAPMLARYSDTAYRAHGNYGVRYNVSLPLYNDSNDTQTVTLKLQTPVRGEDLEDALRFRQPPDDQVFFRGTVRLRFTNDFGIPQTRYIHVVQRRGQAGEPLVRLTMPEGDRRQVEVEFVYPPDATPPQVLTVETSENSDVIEARTRSEELSNQ